MATIRDTALKMIPVLIFYAKLERTIYYSDLAYLVGYNSNHIGKHLGVIEDILEDVRNNIHEDIPTLNGVAINKIKGVPSYGFDYVFTQYSDLEDAQKQELTDRENKRAAEYDWNAVLSYLGLAKFTPIAIDNRKISLSHQYVSGSGEGIRHKKLKEYILNNPSSIGIKNVVKREIEYPLLSGDRVDVYFELKNNEYIAIEVKSSISDDEDTLRGLFQCVKYKAVILAEHKISGADSSVRSILVLEKKLSDANKRVSIVLGNEVKVLNDLAK